MKKIRNNKCIDCDALISRQAKRCLICKNKGQNNPNYGKHRKCSEETKNKIGKANTGKIASKATKLKLSLMRKGDNNSNWKGGITKTKNGYILIYSPNHPHKSKSNYMLEHRLVMEEHLGRYLTPEEVVHHRGIKYSLGSIKNRQDNRIENLKLFKSNGEHAVEHSPKRNRISGRYSS